MDVIFGPNGRKKLGRYVFKNPLDIIRGNQTLTTYHVKYLLTDQRGRPSCPASFVAFCSHLFIDNNGHLKFPNSKFRIFDT